MIDYLANPNKQRLKPDGTNISAWLQGLSLFAGAVCKKYPEMEIVGILSYISSQLRNGNSLDLVVLKGLSFSRNDNFEKHQTIINNDNNNR